MMIRYPYIVISICALLAPIMMMTILQASMIILMLFVIDGIDSIDYVYDFMEETDEKILVVFPFYTYHAYEKNSLADIGTEQCNGCELYQLNSTDFDTIYNDGVSDVGGSVFNILDHYYDRTSDTLVAYEDDILTKMMNDITNSTTPQRTIYDYDKVILMRNEYVTAEFYQAIEKHDNVIYMFPDAMTKQVYLDSNDVMKLAGDIEPLHPQSFEFADDNRCEDWRFIKVDNGWMMNCTPDIAIINNYEMLLTIRDI